jgi:hypothetical protein
MADDDLYLAAQRRKSRARALLLALLVLGGAAGFFWKQGQEAARVDGVVARGEAAIASADFGSLKDASREAGQELSTNSRAPATVLAVDARAELLIHVLYTGVRSQRQRAEEMLGIAEERDAQHPAVRLTRAMFEASVGDPQRALSGLQGQDVPAVLADQAAAAKAEALVRSGDLPGALTALEGVTTGIGHTWAARVAWRAGDLERAGTEAVAALAVSPKNEAAGILAELVRARRAEPEQAEAALRQLASGPAPLSALHAADVAVELSRVLRRAGKVDQADELLESSAEADENSPVLRAELSRVKRFQGSFGAAATLADKGLRTQGDDPELLAEFAAAVYFNDGAEAIEDRARRVPAGSEDSAGVRRANAMAALVRGSGGQAVAGLEATRQLGVPGETDLWLAEAWMRSGEPGNALAAARRAEELLTESMGPTSREVAVARMYEALALAASGTPEEAGPLLELAWTEQNQNPWTAWVYGRYHLAVENRADARTALLLACHRGQDFALSCLDAADVYESASGGRSRATLKELRRHYLRTAPKGWHASEVRAALDR